MADLITAFKLKIGSGTDDTIAFSSDKKIVKTVDYGTDVSKCKITVTFTGTAKYSTTSAEAAAGGTSLTTAVQSGEIDCSTNNTIYINVVNSSVTEKYEVKIVVLPPTPGSCENITKVGWFAAKCIEDDLDTLSSGKLTVPLPSGFVPKYVISLNFSATGGSSYHGNYDIASNTLYVYNGTSAASATTSVKYQLILMQ